MTEKSLEERELMPEDETEKTEESSAAEEATEEIGEPVNEESHLADAELLETEDGISRWRGSLPWILSIVALFVGIGFGTLLAGDSEPEEEAGGEMAADENDHQEGATTWTCSMHPQVQSEEPGQCPICGMDLIPVEEGDGSEKPGPNEVQLTERARVLAEINTIPVLRDPSHEMRVHLLGRLDHDETRVRTVTAWTGGRIDDLHVATTGEKIRRGQTIATLYSPEIYAAHRDLLQAKSQLETLDASMSFSKKSAEATLKSARQKLKLLGVPERELKRMEKADEAWTQIRIRSPFSGTVIERMVNEGTYVQPGTGLYKLTDLSKLWVQLDAYESDLARLSEGQTVELTVSAYPGEVFEGRVAFIDPVVNRNTRTARVRVEVSNPEGRLRPGMFAEAVVKGEATDAAPPLIIPETAPLFSGRRSVVYVEVPGKERPTYEAREVKLGPKMGDAFPVVAGLKEGERVVVHGAFTLDADLQIRGGKSLMGLSDDTSEHALDRVVDVTPDFQAKLTPVFEHYLVSQKALAEDDLKAAKAAAVRLHEAAEAFEPQGQDEPSEAWRKLRPSVIKHARQFEHSTTIDGARLAFNLLSKNMARTLERFGNPTESPLRLAYCPMAFDNRGAEWIQREADIDNSYFGEEMRSCGEIRETIPTGNYLVRPEEEDDGEDESGSDGKAAQGGHNH